MAAWPSRHWLVIDDYHLVTDAEAAEVFVQAVAKRAGIRLFVASRVRPRWLTERMIMYGDVVELERGDLVMDQTEARSALNDIDEAAANSVLARAEGWPAAIGLAKVLSMNQPVAVRCPTTTWPVPGWMAANLKSVGP